jgi:hypothetical protein
MKYNPKPQILPKIQRLANPEYKEEYEMPAEYQAQAKQLIELIESRDEYARIMPALPPDAFREAKPHFDKLNSAVEELEEKLAYEYERYQEERRREQELNELTWGDDWATEENFIRIKHERPYIFEEFAEEAAEGMTDAERDEQFTIIARREAEELEDILSGKTNAPEYENLYIKHLLPDEWMPELLLQILHVGFHTDSFFEINYEALDRLRDTQREFLFHVSDAMPVRRRNIEEWLLDVKPTLGAGRRFLLDYAGDAIKSGKFEPLEEGYTEYLDGYLNSLEKCPYWKYVIIKHTMPEKLDEYVRIVTEDLSPEETEDFLKSAAESEEKDLDVLAHSLENERITTERVLQRRAAPGYEKIEGPQLSERVKTSMAQHEEWKKQREKDTPPGKIEHDLTAVFRRYLKAFYAVTGGGGYAPARYEDEQSRKDEELDKVLEDAMRNVEILYVVMKHQKPEKFDEFHNIVTGHMSSYELKEFQKNIARLEATRLEEILGGKK